MPCLQPTSVPTNAQGQHALLACPAEPSGNGSPTSSRGTSSMSVSTCKPKSFNRLAKSLCLAGGGASMAAAEAAVAEPNAAVAAATADDEDDHATARGSAWSSGRGATPSGATASSASLGLAVQDGLGAVAKPSSGRVVSVSALAKELKGSAFILRWVCSTCEPKRQEVNRCIWCSALSCWSSPHLCVAGDGSEICRRIATKPSMLSLIGAATSMNVFFLQTRGLFQISGVLGSGVAERMADKTPQTVALCASSLPKARATSRRDRG
mmetsp:Transcript_55809/g.160354  ORF Transcript_55809/g.160354 Transcript_55809/m.160354 type:complete len:267 (-) Transcript_55809:92-892(-)